MTLTRINYARSRRVLELEFADGISGELSAEFLRVHSPSAEVRGHSPGQETLQTGKCDVQVSAINPVGHYAIQLVFDDGHDSGLFSWDYLRELCSKQEELWQSYLDQLAAAGASRDSDIQVLNFTP